MKHPHRSVRNSPTRPIWDQIQFLSVPRDRVTYAGEGGQVIFSRAAALNVLHDGPKDRRENITKSVLCPVDVDMRIEASYLLRVVQWVGPGTIYFPIVFSEYRPSTALLTDLVLHDLSEGYRLPKNETGLWRNFGYGMYALSSTDALGWKMNEKFTGWGGEDNDFYKTMVKKRSVHMIREEEPGLVHKWHAKYCDLGSSVQDNMLKTW